MFQYSVAHCVDFRPPTALTPLGFMCSWRPIPPKDNSLNVGLGTHQINLNIQCFGWNTHSSH